MESSADGKRQCSSRTGFLHSDARLFDGYFFSGNDNLAVAIVVGCGHNAINTGADFLHFFCRQCQYRRHCPRSSLTCLLHCPGTYGHKTESFLEIHSTCCDKCREFSQRMSGHHVRMEIRKTFCYDYRVQEYCRLGDICLFEIIGGVLDGTKAGSGAQMGAITAWSGSTVTVNGGTVQGNPKSLYAYSATVNIHAGTVEGNQLYISGDTEAKLPSTVNITGGNVPKDL